MKKKTLFPSLFLIFLITFPCLASAFIGKVIGIADGDTIMRTVYGPWSGQVN